jgi:hypothetical protein
MLYVPLIVGFAAGGGAENSKWVGLVAAVTGLFLSKEAAGLLIRRKAKAGPAFWLGVYLMLTAFCLAPLLSIVAAGPLLQVGLAGAVVFALHTALVLVPARKRLDRSVWGEMLGAAGLSLTAPAAYALSRGSIVYIGWFTWLACAAYFSAAVVYVKMWLEAAKLKKSWSRGLSAHVSRPTLLTHVALAVSLLLAAVLTGSVATLLLVAFAPALVRALVGCSMLTPQLPNLKLVGLSESVLALWFCLFASLALSNWS